MALNKENTSIVMTKINLAAPEVHVDITYLSSATKPFHLFSQTIYCLIPLAIN